jgi:phosphohistidine phosphatase
VVETISDVAAGYGSPIRPVYDERIYLASSATLLELVRTADDDADRLLLVGHNPGLEMLALMLTDGNDGDELRAELATKYPTGTVAEISFDVDQWGKVGAGTGRLRHFIRPRDLDPDLGPDAEDR